MSGAGGGSRPAARRRRRGSLRRWFRGWTGGGCGGASLMGFLALASMVGFLVFLGPIGVAIWVGCLIGLAVLIIRQRRRRGPGGGRSGPGRAGRGGL